MCIKSRKEQFIENINKRFNNKIKILSDYITESIEIKCRCEVCANEWFTKPTTLKRSKVGCPKCANINKRITNAEFLKRMEQIHYNKYDPLEPYVNVSTKIKLFCNQCYNIFYIQPQKLWAGQGCPHCARKKHNFNFTPVNKDEFEQKVKEKFNNQIDLLTKYINSQTKVKCKCRQCNYEFEILPGHLLIGQGCRQCNYEFEILPGHLLIGQGCKKCYYKNKTKTNEQFLAELQQINSNIIPLENYKGNNIKIRCKCTKCNQEWLITSRQLLNKQGCPICALEKIRNARRKTHDKFLKDLYKIHKNKYEPLEIYTNAATKINFKCTICNNVFAMRPNSILLGQGCPICALKKLKNIHIKTHKQFLQDLKQIHGNNLIPLENYKGTKAKIKFRCNICNNEWSTSPQSLLCGSGCPNCNLSKGEKYIQQYLAKNKFIYQTQFKIKDCKNIKPLPFDFAIFKTENDKNNHKPWFLIEYDGSQHWELFRFSKNNEEKEIQQLRKRQKRDLIKTNYCLNNNIPLIRLSYCKEYKNMKPSIRPLLWKHLEQKLQQLFIQRIINILKK